MNVPQANRLLDKAKDGQPMPAHLIDYALFLTGDLDGHFGLLGESQGYLHGVFDETQSGHQMRRLVAQYLA